jgi:hypothetical protein
MEASRPMRVAAAVVVAALLVVGCAGLGPAAPISGGAPAPSYLTGGVGAGGVLQGQAGGPHTPRANGVGIFDPVDIYPATIDAFHKVDLLLQGEQYSAATTYDDP